MKRIYSKFLLFLTLALAMAKKTYAKILALSPERAKKIYAVIPLLTGKKPYVRFLIIMNISILLLATAFLVFTQGIPRDYNVDIYGPSVFPVKPGSFSKSALPSNSSDTHENTPASSGIGSQIIVDPPHSGSSTQHPFSTLNLGIYKSDPNGGQYEAFDAIDWSIDGPIIPGQVRNSSVVYLKNEGNIALTPYLSSQAWSFEDNGGNALAQEYQQYFTLGWDYDNSVLGVNQVRPVIFTLNVRSDVVDVATFSFDLVVVLGY